MGYKSGTTTSNIQYINVVEIVCKISSMRYRVRVIHVFMNDFEILIRELIVTMVT